MGQQPQRGYVSTDPNFGTPIVEKGYVSTDPNFGEPLRVQTKGENLPEEGTPSPTWADRLGLNEPTDSMIHGFHRGVGAAAVDMLQGATANVVNRLNRGGDPAMRQIFNKPPVEEAQDVMQAPDTVPAKVGGVLPVAAEMAIPGPGVVRGAKAAVGMIPNAARAGEKFQEVMGAAKNVPIDVAEVGDVALRISKLAENGGSMPMSVRKLLYRLTDPKKGPLTYDDARDFASNISRLSVDEMKRIQPVVKREIAQLAAALNKANAEAAKLAGKGAEYKAAMREYARAMKLRDALDAVIRKAKQAALPAAGLGGAAYWFGRD